MWAERTRLAETVASGIGAVPVVTTATDVEKKFAVDVFAKDHGFVITDRKLAKEISADILAGEPVGVFSDFRFSAWKKIPEGLFGDRICKRNLWVTVSGKEKKGIPENRVLRLIPRCVALGIGCKRGTPVEKIRTAVESAMERTGSICEASLRRRASTSRSRSRDSSNSQRNFRCRF